jgi:hypothetical protein
MTIMYPYPSSSHSQPHPHPSHLSSQPPPLYPPPHLPPPSSLNGAIPPLANSSALPPHTLPLSSQHPSNSTYRSFPSSILAPMSPTRTKVYPRSDDRPATSGSPRDMDESGSDDDDDKEKHKLEIRREKNRVKQRNLRSVLSRTGNAIKPETCVLTAQCDGRTTSPSSRPISLLFVESTPRCSLPSLPCSNEKSI